MIAVLSTEFQKKTTIPPNKVTTVVRVAPYKKGKLFIFGIHWWVLALIKKWCENIL